MKKILLITSCIALVCGTATLICAWMDTTAGYFVLAGIDFLLAGLLGWGYAKQRKNSNK